jgi:cytochrome c-type biogenesis protein
MVGVTVAASLGRDVLVRRLAARAGLIQRVAGGLLIVAGVYQLYLFLFEFGGRELLGLA